VVYVGCISFENIQKVLHDPTKLRLVYALAEKKARPINRRWYQQRAGPSDDFVGEDWGLLIILDAARPDMLGETTLADRADIVSTRTSPGSYSHQFLQESFAGRQLHDTVYISGNPHTPKLPDDTFHAVVNLHIDAWDADLMTIPPESVADETVQAIKRFPNKRIIAHFMQPHFPFLGETGSQIDAGIGEELNGKGAHPWKNIYRGKADCQAVIEAFRENHQVVVPYVRKVLNEVTCRTVVSADHTNLIGERGFPIPIRQFGHPIDYPHPALRTVPWYVFDGEDREITAESPGENDTVPKRKTIEQRLAALGYR
jgi:hypothetical protein